MRCYSQLFICKMENKTITAIEKGFGEGSQYYKLGDYVSEIKRTVKSIEFADGGISKEIEVYQVWSKSGIICEIEANSSITLYF